MKTGIIFDIQRFALHDGPGIRTAVFLKGCPLRCAWCSNPESFELSPQLAWMNEKCSLNRDCITICPEEVFHRSGSQLKINYSECSLCGDCVESCLSNALKIYGYRTDSNFILKEVLKDIDYYQNSGGGITLSGGEPFAQPEFCLEILKKAKISKLHTCLETSGHTTPEVIRESLSWTDLYLYDYKLTDPKKHLRYTHAGNEKILSNLDLILNEGGNVILRCPIIPGVNNTPQHFEGIASLAGKYPSLKGIEVLSYHNWGNDKYRQIGIKPAYTAKTVSKEQRQKWIDELRSMGISNVN